MATINATIGELVTFYLDGAPEDIEDWQVRIYDTDGDVVVGPDADDFATLTEGVESATVGPGEVQYSVAITVPTTAATYTVAWMTDGNESEPDTLIVAAVATLVTLAEVKDYLNIPQSDTAHDAKLTRAILTARPLVEAICGPIVPQTITEWHDGGTSAIQVRRAPSTAPGTSPILTLTNVTEYVGSAPYVLSTVADPSLGSTYSVMIDGLGTITRRTSGGGVGVFAGGDRTVKVVYVAGQAVVPANVVDGTLELISVNYVKTQPYGRGRTVVEDENREASGPHMGWYIPGRVRQMLSPNRRGPSIA